MPTLTPITITNHNFASPVWDGYGQAQVPTGWTYTGNANNIWMGTAYAHARIGSQYIGFQNTNTLSQTNLATIEANTSYIFQAYIAGGMGTFVIEITANGVAVASYEDFPGSGFVWPRYSVVWKHTGTHTGQQLGIRLRATINYSTQPTTEVSFGNVSLNKYAAPVFDWMLENLNEMSEGTARIIPGFTDSYIVGAYAVERAPDDQYVTHSGTVFGPWPAGAWDESAGHYYIFGRGHAVGGANEISRWVAAENRWERCFLPSGLESQGDPNGYLRSKGGFDTGGPLGAHALNSFNLLPLSRRTIFYSGGTFNSGNPIFQTWNGSAYVKEGPFLYDLTKIDRFKVGGPAGSGRIASDQGNSGWSNRKNISNPIFYFTGADMTFQCPVVENSRDVVYTYTPSGSTNYLVRHEIVDINNPANDVITQITANASSFWYDAAFGCSFKIPDRRVLIFVGAYYSAEPANDKYIAYVDLDAGTPQLLRPSVSSNLSCPGGPSALYDPVRKRVVAIGGPSNVDATMVTFSVPDTLTDTWTVANLSYTGDAVRSDDQTACSIFKYSRKYDCYFMPTKSHPTYSHEMWVYKPVGWSPLSLRASARRALM